MSLTRRAFLRLGLSAAAALVAPRRPAVAAPSWPQATQLARVTVVRLRLRSRPHPDSVPLGTLSFDDVVVVARSVVGKGFYPHNHVWFETPEGYLYASWAQPVRNTPREVPPTLPSEGIYVEVAVPYTDARSRPEPDGRAVYRLYYGATFNVTSLIAAGGTTWYRINDENGVRMYAEAVHLRPIAPEEFAPISTGASEKSVRVSLSRQSLSAFEGRSEVFRTRIASGREYFADGQGAASSLTPLGSRPIWSKRASRHMSGGTVEDGYDLPGVPWVSYFAGNGAAIHGTYWHNDFGAPQSAGCLNVRPEDAKWLFRWTAPAVPYVPGYITVEWPGGTRVIVEE